MLKRGIDILVAGVMLIVCMPLLVLCAILVKVDSRGPFLFRQLRMGRGFRTFRLIKLRTMNEGEEGSVITLGFDARVTRIGRWLRRWKLDEIPQLWNVLRGEMSLVGPRPVIPELAREFASDYHILLRVRPGLTDPATLQYCHEAEILSRVDDPLRYFKTVVTPDKLRISSDYLRRSTTASDLAVLLKTALAVLSPAPPPDPGPALQSFPHPASPASWNQD